MHNSVISQGIVQGSENPCIIVASYCDNVFSKIKDFLTQSMYIMFVDCPDFSNPEDTKFMATSLLNNFKIKYDIVSVFKKDFENESYNKYAFCVLKCKKKYMDDVFTALDQLPNKMIICGRTDYLDFCNDFVKQIDISDEDY